MRRKEFDDKIDDFIELLERQLPEVDYEHRDEIFSIAELLKARISKFANNYGLVED